MILAALSAYFALTPLIYSAQKTRQMKEDTQAFYEQLESMQMEQEPPRTNPNDHVPIPYENLYLDMRDYNKWLDATKQSGLNSREAYQDSYFDLTAYGLPDQVFGVIRIPRMDLEMPLYLGASYENMSNGASVLAQTSIPIGGENCNSVIAGHRSWNGYKYFLDIELLQYGDEVYITNLWETLTYKVVDIKIINPNDVNAILIQKDRDLVTLLTCHPYGSGGLYRYLVFCERVKEAAPANTGAESLQ